MKVKKKYVFILIIGLALIAPSLVDVYIGYIRKYDNSMENLKNCVKTYIHENEGKFPSSEKTLIAWAQKNNFNIEDFEKFSILYGVKFQDIKRSNTILYDLHTNKQILLIEGPFVRVGMKEIYKDISLQLYLEMKQSEERGNKRGERKGKTMDEKLGKN